MFFKVLTSIWIQPKICGGLKNKVQILESKRNVFANVMYILKSKWYDTNCFKKLERD